MDAQLNQISHQLGLALTRLDLTLAAAESCTGGWVAQVVTHTAGSSAWFDRGFITYSNDAKVEMLGVDPETIARYGAVSQETAAEMAAGALVNSNAMISLAVSGVAGPAGGSPDKPVGTVCFAWCKLGDEPQTERHHFDGDRESVRHQAVVCALTGLLARLK
ncbi:MAG: nicotinamide-nucleotide amidohydrolase family protein [Rhodocyclales bacterium]|nr:nicotinamide-nucleotide amidohydrolase family protein [Rhodocyclales bacterium]